jgi:hypothetical protein
MLPLTEEQGGAIDERTHRMLTYADVC